MADDCAYLTTTALWEPDVQWNDDGIWSDSAWIVGLLPSNRTAQEDALDRATGRIAEVPVNIRTVWRSDEIAADLLPWLAWALSVDEWDNGWAEGQKRAVIAASIDVHRHKGTRGAVKRALAATGFGDAELIERRDGALFDGSISRDGSSLRAGVSHWAQYRLVLTRPITIAQAATVRRILADVAPLRCELSEIIYTQALHLYNATVPRDGTYTRGVA